MLSIWLIYIIHLKKILPYGWDGDTLAYESTNLYTKHYVYENGSFVPLIQATYRQQISQHQTPQWEHGYDYDKDPLWHTEQQANPFDRVWFYHCDHLGTPQEMSDQTGAIVWTANYKAWGICKPENHTKRDIWDSEIITNNIRFQGQYYDDETGLHYNRYRYYSPYVGRFISKDPIGLLGGLNTFAYAPNPVEWIDPLGLKQTKHDEGKYTVYALYENEAARRADKPYYVGITEDARFNTRRGEHKDSGRLPTGAIMTKIPGKEGLTYGKARGVEQARIEYYETKTGKINHDMNTKGTTFDERGNRINSFDTNSKTREAERQKYFNEAREAELKTLPCRGK